MNGKPERTVRALAILSLVALLWLTLVAAQWGRSGTRLEAAGNTSVISVVVRSGDTIWQLAIDHGPSGADPRRTIDAIRRINGLSTTDVRPGMVLEIPTRHSRLL